MRRRWLVPVAVVLVAALAALVQAGWNRSLVRREIVLSEREAPVAWSRRDETALWLRLDYATPTDSAWGGWIGAARLAAMGIDTSRAAVRARPAVRPAFAVLELDGPSFREHVGQEMTRQARELALDSVPQRRDSLLALRRKELERGSRLVLVDVGRDPAELARRHPDGARQLILPARLYTYREDRFRGVGTPPDSVLGARVELENPQLLVTGRPASTLRPPPTAGYRVTVATGRGWAPWVRRVE